jgi:hypothetical protein
MKNSKGTKRLVSGIPRANDGCQHFAFCIFQFPFFITHFLAACEPKMIIFLAGRLPTDGNADLRMNKFAACGIELKTVKVSARKLDHGSRASCCRSRTCPRTVHPQFGFAIRGNEQTLSFCRFAAQPFGGSGLMSRQIRRSGFADLPRSDSPKSGSYFQTIPKRSRSARNPTPIFIKSLTRRYGAKGQTLLRWAFAIE